MSYTPNNTNAASVPTDAASIIAVAREAEKNKGPREMMIGGHPHLLMPDGGVLPLEQYEENPARKRAHVTLSEVASFIAYVKAHIDPAETHIFASASETGGSFNAFLDYHPRDSKLARNGDHRCDLILECTPEWKRWIANNGKLLTQEQFAEFIEENLADITDPDGATILELAQLLQGKKEVTFKSGRNLRDGSMVLQYAEDIKLQGGGINRKDDEMKLPDRFTLGLVPFRGGDGVQIEARLRFRIGQNGQLHFAYVLNRPYKLVEGAIDAARDRIEGETGIAVHIGAVGKLK